MTGDARRALLLAPLLLLAVALTGLWTDRARREAGVLPSPARIPLGGFEPLVLDLFWLRAEACLEQGRYPEAVAMIRITTELQPRVPENWQVLGNLLAWRTSESAGEAEVQWRWAREGIRVVERGLAHNPGDPGLLLTLATLYMHRVSLNPEVARVAEEELGEPPLQRARRLFLSLADRTGDADCVLNYAVATGLLGQELAHRGQAERARELLLEALRMLAPVAEEGGPVADRIDGFERTLDELSGR